MWTAAKYRRYFSPLFTAGQRIRGLSSWRTPFRTGLSRQPTKRALLIAINYTNLRRHGLKLPQRDVEEFRELLITQYNYNPEFITVLTDNNDPKSSHYPSKENIMKYLETFYESQEPGDQYVFYFAGHAFQLDTDDIKEEDKKDEFLLPSVDPQSEAFRKFEDAALEGTVLGEIPAEDGIVDDVLYDYLVRPLNSASRLTAIFDTCHSNTLLDLPHHRCNRVCKWTSLVRRGQRRFFEIVMGVLDKGKATHPADELVICKGYGNHCRRIEGVRNNIICLSACKDSENVFEHEEIQSMTQLLIKFLREQPRPTLKDTMYAVSVSKMGRWPNIVEKGKEASPQLSTRRPARMNSFFYL